MGFMTSPPALADIDGDGDVDGTLRRIKQGTGISLTLSNNILTVANTGSGVEFSDGTPNNGDGNDGDVGIDYTNGDVYRKNSGSWVLIDTIPSIARVRMFTSTYVESAFSAGKFGLDSGKYYFHHSSFPGTSSVATAEAYLNNNDFGVGTRLIFQQIDDADNVSIWRVTDSTIYKDGVSGYESGLNKGTNFVGMVLTQESGVSFSTNAKYNVFITYPVNFIFDSSGNATIGADLTVKEFILTTAETNTTSTDPSTVDEWPIATYRSAKYEYHITNTGADPDEYQTGEMMVLHDGSNSKHNSYGVIFTGAAALGTFSTDVSSGNCRLRFTAASTDAMTIKVARKAIKV